MLPVLIGLSVGAPAHNNAWAWELPEGFTNANLLSQLSKLLEVGTAPWQPHCNAVRQI